MWRLLMWPKSSLEEENWDRQGKMLKTPRASLLGTAFSGKVEWGLRAGNQCPRGRYGDPRTEVQELCRSPSTRNTKLSRRAVESKGMIKSLLSRDAEYCSPETFQSQPDLKSQDLQEVFSLQRRYRMGSSTFLPLLLLNSKGKLGLG